MYIRRRALYSSKHASQQELAGRPAAQTRQEDEELNAKSSYSDALMTSALPEKSAAIRGLNTLWQGSTRRGE